MRVSICSNVFSAQSGILSAEEKIKTLACHEIFANSDYVLTGTDEKSVAFENDGVRVTFIVAEDNLCRAVQEICVAKAQNDFVIVSYPCSVTTGIYPPARIRQMCRTMVRNGADVVMCRMGRGISSYELFRNATILYGYGEQKSAKNGGKKGEKEHSCQETGMIVHLDISDKIELQFIPMRIAEMQMVSLEGKERQKCLEQLVENSEKLKRSSEQNS